MTAPESSSGSSALRIGGFALLGIALRGRRVRHRGAGRRSVAGAAHRGPAPNQPVGCARPGASRLADRPPPGAVPAGGARRPGLRAGPAVRPGWPHRAPARRHRARSRCPRRCPPVPPAGAAGRPTGHRAPAGPARPRAAAGRQRRGSGRRRRALAAPRPAAGLQQQHDHRAGRSGRRATSAARAGRSPRSATTRAGSSRPAPCTSSPAPHEEAAARRLGAEFGLRVEPRFAGSAAGQPRPDRDRHPGLPAALTSAPLSGWPRRPAGRPAAPGRATADDCGGRPPGARR